MFPAQMKRHPVYPALFSNTSPLNRYRPPAWCPRNPAGNTNIASQQTILQILDRDFSRIAIDRPCKYSKAIVGLI
jgi:hypothetical protein